MTCDVDKVATVVGGKTARACDSCIRKRARWYCAADDAFLCQSCDSSVHSANPLSRRHERVRLKSASFKSRAQGGSDETRSDRVPSWHSRKARTPRGKQQSSSSPSPNDGVRNLFYLVPDAMSDETASFDDGDGQLLYGRVPIFDSFSADAENENSNSNAHSVNRCASFGVNEMKGFVGKFCNDVGFLPSDMDLEEFAADVETLLGKGLDEESFGIDGLGLMECAMEVERSLHGSVMDERVKDEVDEIEMAKEPFELSFDYDEEEEEENAAAGAAAVLDDCEAKVFKTRKILLRLDYEGIMAAWDGSSPWISGTRPEFDPNECWPTCMATCEIESHRAHLEDHTGGPSGRLGRLGDGGREARVFRYREKRRTRLFSKKIRYEVRKLNAEKRPRMKGRFVKRPPSSFLPQTSNVSLFA